MDSNAPFNIEPKIWGPHIWATIHTLALKADSDNEIGPFLEFTNSLLFLLPCDNCRHDYSNWCRKNQGPNTGEAFAWSVKLHNYVNDKLKNGQTYDVDEARAIWQSDSCSYTCSKKPVADRSLYFLLIFIIVILVLNGIWKYSVSRKS